jgi:hypothetical protein
MSKPTHRRCKAAYRSCCASVQYRPPDLAAAEDVRGADGISNQTGWSCGQDSAAPRSGRVAALANRGGLCETQINHDTLQDGCHTPCDALHRSQLPCGNATTCDPHITRQFNSATAVIAQQGTTSSTSKIDAAPALLRCEHRHATHISVHVTRTRVQNSMIMASSSRVLLLLVHHSCGSAAVSASSNVQQVGGRALHGGKGVMQSAAAGHPPIGHPVGKRTCKYCCRCMFHRLTRL